MVFSTIFFGQNDTIPPQDSVEAKQPLPLPTDGALYGVGNPRETVSRHLHYLLASAL